MPRGQFKRCAIHGCQKGVQSPRSPRTSRLATYCVVHAAEQKRLGKRLDVEAIFDKTELQKLLAKANDFNKYPIGKDVIPVAQYSKPVRNGPPQQ